MSVILQEAREREVSEVETREREGSRSLAMARRPDRPKSLCDTSIYTKGKKEIKAEPEKIKDQRLSQVSRSPKPASTGIENVHGSRVCMMSTWQQLCVQQLR